MAKRKKLKVDRVSHPVAGMPHGHRPANLQTRLDRNKKAYTRKGKKRIHHADIGA